ncbi:MAG: hypothetical protein HY751_03035 [Nitrospinae bacterium]|nr:hypothetical protein [Nitrospinota bacterium]
MKTLSNTMLAALSSGVIKPAWLLKLAMKEGAAPGRVFYLADRPVTLWGANWLPLVKQWGGIDRYFDPNLGGVSVSDITVELVNFREALGPGEPNISWYFRKYDLAASTATIYLWLDGAGLMEPSGSSQNDLLTIITGAPELAGEITPFICPLDIVAGHSGADPQETKLGDLLTGKYSANQWEGLPENLVGQWKPQVFGDNAVSDGVALLQPKRAGTLAGPDALFDPATGVNYILVNFGASGADAIPFPAPCDIYLGDWRVSVIAPPYKISGSLWRYDIGGSGPANYFIPTPLLGAEPLFIPSAQGLWRRSDETGYGPYSSAEPPTGVPYQFHHGPSDTGNASDGHNPGKPGPFIKSIFVNGEELAAADYVIDNPFGIAWLKLARAGALGKIGNPKSILLKWTAVDPVFTTGDQFLRPQQLTAQYPYGYNADTNPCILGDFAVPASGGGAPASTTLGLINSIRYPYIGARLASVRFVMRYTGLEVSTGSFNLEIFGQSYSFAASELNDGAGIASSGWWLNKDQKGAQFEIWPNNNGYPYTQTSPDPRYWDILELSRDVTADAISAIDGAHGFDDRVRLWFSGTQWPLTNSFILLSVELEALFDGVESALESPKVTAIMGDSAVTAGDIIQRILPSGSIGSGFTDPSLPALQYRVDSQQDAFTFACSVALSSNRELSFNNSSGKWDLVEKSAITSNFNLPPATGGLAVINEAGLLAGDDGAPMISRLRSAPQSVINEVAVTYTDTSGAVITSTFRDQGSVDVYGVKRLETVMPATASTQTAEEYALEILNEYCDVADYYKLTFPLGPALALEPNDIATISASMDSLSNTKMRVVSVEIDPGNLAEGDFSTITLNLRRYLKARRGYGQTTFGQAPFGLGQIQEN